MPAAPAASAPPLPPPDGPTRATNRFSDIRPPTVPGNATYGGMVATARAIAVPSTAPGPTLRARASLRMWSRMGRADQKESISPTGISAQDGQPGEDCGDGVRKAVNGHLKLVFCRRVGRASQGGSPAINVSA